MPVKKVVPKKKTPPVKVNEFYWLAECHAFVKKFTLTSITSPTDPKIYLVDQYLKMVMDRLIQNHKAMLDRAANGSSMTVLLAVIRGALKDPVRPRSDKISYPASFFQVLDHRMTENLLLKKWLTLPEKRIEATTKLRQRGLMS